MSQLTIAEKGEVIVVNFVERRLLDDAVIQQIGREFARLTMEAAAGRKLILNFENVVFMASNMIGQVVKLNKQCKNDKIKLKLCAISPNILEVFQITGLTKILEIYPDEAAALEAFEPKRRGWFG